MVGAGGQTPHQEGGKRHATGRGRARRLRVCDMVAVVVLGVEFPMNEHYFNIRVCHIHSVPYSKNIEYIRVWQILANLGDKVSCTMPTRLNLKNVTYYNTR